jgi:hypothetical protein
MCAEASTVLRAVAADCFFNCWYLEIPSDNRIRHVPRRVQLETFYNFYAGSGITGSGSAESGAVLTDVIGPQEALTLPKQNSGTDDCRQTGFPVQIAVSAAAGRHIGPALRTFALRNCACKNVYTAEPRVSFRTRRAAVALPVCLFSGNKTCDLYKQLYFPVYDALQSFQS